MELCRGETLPHGRVSGWPGIRDDGYAKATLLHPIAVGQESDNETAKEGDDPGGEAFEELRRTLVQNVSKEMVKRPHIHISTAG
jgi:hypothetical protein